MIVRIETWNSHLSGSPRSSNPAEKRISEITWHEIENMHAVRLYARSEIVLSAIAVVVYQPIRQNTIVLVRQSAIRKVGRVVMYITSSSAIPTSFLDAPGLGFGIDWDQVKAWKELPL